jgi:hypothetical protein
MKINRFEELECWQEARVLTKTAYDYTKHTDFIKDFRLSGQITGASNRPANLTTLDCPVCGFSPLKKEKISDFIFLPANGTTGSTGQPYL